MDGWEQRRESARIARHITLMVALLAATVVLAACGKTAAPATSAGGAATQRNEGGQVTVDVTWGGAATGPIFRVALDTHTVELDGYDLRQLAVLRIDQGREVRPSGWDAPQGGHHREGTLTFPAIAADGSPVIGSAGTLELVIRDVAGVPERVFRWTP